ncbi:MAG: translation initiation factor IF-1 [Bacteroidia bacterium]|jgi:translation initiation factor IF-1
MEAVNPETFTATLVKMSGDIWSVGFEVPSKHAKVYIGNKAKRVICTLNETATYHCALMPSGQTNYFINVNAKLQKQLKITVGDMVHVAIEPDTSKYGLPMPEELEAIFHIDPEGSDVFHALTPGKQRTLIHLVGKPKSSEIRIKKAMVVVEYLKEVNGKLDFKQLNVAIKRANKNSLNF